MSVTVCKDETALISVVVPVYKAENVLPRCLDSIVGQSYKNLQIILVDDGSPDRSGVICDEYAQKDPRVQVIHTPNKGVYVARNLALNVVRGDYVVFVDADDWVDADMIASLLKLLLEADADIAQCGMKNEGSYQQLRNKYFGKTMVYEREELTKAFFEENITHGLLGKLFRAEIWKERRFEEGYYHVDAMTMAQLEEFCRRVVRMDDELYHYDTTGDSITRGRKKPLHIKSKERLFEIYSSAAQRAPSAGSFFICSEIPCAGRLIPPGGEISLKMAVDHIRKMHAVFMRHWANAKKTQRYREASAMKKVLWKIFRCAPVCAAVFTSVYSRVKRMIVR